jgi:protein dithiol:quinone oxidoreductase
MFIVNFPSRWLGSMALICLVALGLGLLAQYQLDMRPCAWCVLQRAIYLLLALGLGVAAQTHRFFQKTVLSLCLLLCISGVASALYQHQVAEKTFSCNLSVADKIISALHLEELLPSVFGVMATCADAAVSLLGVPFAFWSLGLFVLLGCASLRVLQATFLHP